MPLPPKLYWRVPGAGPASPPGAMGTCKDPDGDVHKQYAAFIQAAERYGLPVKFLHYVSCHYSIDEGSDDFVRAKLNHLRLAPDTMEGIKTLSDRVSDAVAELGTLYHESTHAYFDLKADDPQFKEIIEKGVKYYEQAPLKSAGNPKADDSERLFHEAVASYVGWRAAGWWSGFKFLYRALHDRDYTPEQLARVRSIVESEYNKQMQTRVFGYQETGGLFGFGTSQSYTSLPIDEGIATFLDVHLLEGKVPNNFADVVGFRELVKQLQDRSRPRR